MGWGNRTVQTSIGRDETVAFEFRTPADFSSVPSGGSFSLYEFNGPPAARQGGISTSPIGDSFVTGGRFTVGETAPVSTFNNGMTVLGAPLGGHRSKPKKLTGATLKADTTYYWVVRNVPQYQQDGIDSWGVKVRMSVSEPKSKGEKHG